MLKVPNTGANELKEDLKLLCADLSTIATHKGLTLAINWLMGILGEDDSQVEATQVHSGIR
jgi:hypothetical protein